MQFSMHEDCLHINRMDNHSSKTPNRYRHVGTALLEYAFKKSLKAGKGGHIELDAIAVSPVAYYKMGLRKKSSGGVVLHEHISKYLNTQSEIAKSEILTNEFYPILRQDAAKNLKKRVEEITFEEAINYGILSPANQDFADKLATNHQLTEIDCLTMQGPMYLPTDLIELKKSEFLNFIPIGSNLFFSEREAEKRLMNPQLHDLLKRRKLDPANAIEIQKKIEVGHPRWELLLSDIGLEMMKRNYISAWYFAVYFPNLKDMQAIISVNGLEAFEKGYVRHISQLLNLSVGVPAKILSNEGLQALRDGDIIVSEEGYSLIDRQGNILTSVALDNLLRARDTIFNSDYNYQPYKIA